jgi:hypothetical protein
MPRIQLFSNPKAPSPASVAEGLLPAEVAAEYAGKFFYIHNVDSYEFVEKPKGKDKSPWGFLPILSEIRPRAGINGASEIRDGNGIVVGLNDSATRTHHLSKGAVIFDPADPKLGPWQHYCRAHKAENGGRAYVFYTDQGGMSFELLGNGRAKVIEASGVLRLFRAFLRDNGLCNQLSRHCVARMLEIEEQTLQDLITRSRNSPHLNDHVKSATARIEAMKAEWERIQNEAEQQGVQVAAPGVSDE